jgi:hypothetical protein
MKEKILTSKDFDNAWGKIEQKHLDIIYCCDLPKLERRDYIRSKFRRYEGELEGLLKKVDEAKHIAEMKIMDNLNPNENFVRDDETNSLLQLSLDIYRDVNGIHDNINTWVGHWYEDNDDWDQFPDNWVATCRREKDCCIKLNKQDSCKMWENDNKCLF